MRTKSSRNGTGRPARGMMTTMMTMMMMMMMMMMMTTMMMMVMMMFSHKLIFLNSIARGHH